MDDAGLRRLRHKIPVDKPRLSGFIRIMHMVAATKGMEVDEDILSFLLFELYDGTPGADFRGFHPNFLTDQIMAICTDEGSTPERTRENLYASN